MTAWCISWRLQTLGFHMEGLKTGSWRTGVCARVLRRTRAQMDRRTTAPKVSCSAAVWQRGRSRRQWEQDGSEVYSLDQRTAGSSPAEITFWTQMGR